MGLFFRKSFKAGPIRLNLSKSGIGVSAGVKGARVGVSSKGKGYVSGSAGPLRYRKTIGGGKGTATSQGTQRRSTRKITKEVFVDTKVTYSSDVKTTDVNIEKIPPMPEKFSMKRFYALGFLGLIMANPVTILASIVFFIIAIKRTKQNSKLKKDKDIAKELHEKLVNAIGNTNKEEFENIFSEIISLKAHPKLEDYFNSFTLHSILYCLSEIEDENFITKDELNNIKNKLGLSDERYRSIKVITFRSMFDDFLKDYELDEEEEQSIRRLISLLDLSERDIRSELKTIEVMSQIRKEAESNLEPIEVDVNIQKSEDCYYSTKAKIIKEKKISQQTVEGVTYKKIGHVVEKKGTAYLTNKRILLVGSGTYSTKLNKILDVLVTPENNIIELIIDGRKSPLIYTTPESTLFAAKIQKAIEEI
ncbi:DUF4236 domain-containing protein [Orenia marismortui]|uniref:Uncharacterized protein DUF4236 n=1 Tax=Orenia marismortui TaxID=46469 RepID=A0A4V3GXJ7_9FIRM|nr:DUF4236 domain-containing protein [Orenia marismortui]TDX48315.1 uncharacterized protein DUF4236 [Orenia marismortui]